MDLSVVIPTHNSEGTIIPCLNAIYSSCGVSFQVLIVDDGSDDRTLEKVKLFPCQVVPFKETKGPAYARKIGIEKSLSDIVAFVDSDIVISDTTLKKMLEILKNEREIVAIVGILSKLHPNKNFFSVYKNLYINYILRRCPKYIDFIFGSCFAVKKRFLDNIPLTSLNNYGEDTALGIELSNAGNKILLDQTLEVIHLKKYTFLSFVKNDFIIPYHWAKLFIIYKRFKDIIEKRRFFHAQISQIIGIGLAFGTLISFIYSNLISIIFFISFLAINRNFFQFLYRERKVSFLLKAVLVSFIDALIMGCGIISGLTISFYKNILKKSAS
jgi:glycosyltransferase involved in cell wall biosynthesis